MDYDCDSFRCVSSSFDFTTRFACLLGESGCVASEPSDFFFARLQLRNDPLCPNVPRDPWGRRRRVTDAKITILRSASRYNAEWESSIQGLTRRSTWMWRNLDELLRSGFPLFCCASLSLTLWNRALVVRHQVASFCRRVGGDRDMTLILMVYCVRDWFFILMDLSRDYIGSVI